MTDIVRNRLMLGWGARQRGLPSSQGIVTAAILLFCGGLVAYPLVYLVAESFNVSGEDVFPPVEVGLANYTDLIEDWHILANTALVACLATVMAVIFGFLVAWILTRTSCPAAPSSSG